MKTAKRQSKSAGGKRTGKPARASADVDGIHLTHPDRVYWPDANVTKQDLAEYYVSVWDWIAPHIVNRPISIVRGPEGIEGELFFQKHIAANIKESPLRHKVDAKEHDVIAVENLADLVSLVQNGSLEIHVRGSRLDSIESCDRIVFDLDPGEGVGWKDVVAGARETQQRLDDFKLKSFVKLSGGKGVHVVVPITGRRLGRCQGFQPAHCVGDGRRQSGALRRQNDQVAPRRENLYRLFPQYARSDFSGAILDTGSPRCSGVGATVVGATRPQQERGGVHRAQSE